MTEPAPGHLAAVALGDERAFPDVAWIVGLTGATPRRVQTYLARTDRWLAIEQAIRTRHQSAGRDFYAQIRAPLDLYAIVRLLKPRHVVETGVSSGVSSAHLLLALRDNRTGQLHSIDLPTSQRAAQLAKAESTVSLPPGRLTGFAVPEELRTGWDLHIGPSQVLLPVVARGLDRIDLFLHDSYHTPEHLTFELEAVRPKLRPGSIVLADNTEWTGDAFERFAASFGAPVLHRGDSDLVGFRVPARRTPAKRPRATARRTVRRKGTRSARATRSR
jgi:predicted O-methyltransferase YrrM